MPRSIRAALPALAFALLPLLLLPPPALAQEAEPMRVITVTGEGWADAKPDLAVVSLGVSHQAPTAAEAMAMMAEGMTAVLAALTQAGISPSDIQTGQLSLQAAYDYNTSAPTPPLTGYVATQTVDVRVREVGAVGPVLDAVTAGGANQVNGVTFVLDDQKAALEEARTDAVNDARARAEFYANVAGVHLGNLLQIAEGGALGGPQPYYDVRLAEAAAPSVPIAPGQVTVAASVTMTYAIE